MCQSRCVHKCVAVWLLGLVVAMFLLSAWSVRAETMGAVSVEPDGAGGVQVTAGVDVMALKRNDAVKNASWWAKPFVAAKEITVSSATFVKENPKKSALGLAVGLVTVRAVQGKLGDDIDRLRGKGSTGGGGNSDSSLASNIDASVNVSGNDNNVTQNITITPAPVFVITEKSD